MDYEAKDGTGEICFRGDNIMVGYYKAEDKTKETIDEDGWLHTGDIGKWMPNGTLKIIDRKKHIYKLAQVFSVNFFSLKILWRYLRASTLLQKNAKQFIISIPWSCKSSFGEIHWKPVTLLLLSLMKNNSGVDTDDLKLWDIRYIMARPNQSWSKYKIVCGTRSVPSLSMSRGTETAWSYRT